MLSRRGFLQGLASFLLGTGGLTGYAYAIEPRYRLTVARYRIALPGWPAGHAPVRVLVIADVHACEPFMPASRIDAIVAFGNALAPDLTLLAGDYLAGLRGYKTADVPPEVWARSLGGSRAPLGVYAVLGNHDWWDGPEACRESLTGAGVPVLENDAVRLTTEDGLAFWLAGLGDQLAYRRRGGVDDLPGTLARIGDDAPVILLAHEPEIFPKVPERVALTISGHTHGGQVHLPVIDRYVLPARLRPRYAYGHYVEGGKHLVVSAGLGCSIYPVRFLRPPELVVIDLVGGAASA